MWPSCSRGTVVVTIMRGVAYTCLMSSAFMVDVAMSKAISGRIEKCSNDGEHVNVPILGKDSCYRCFCRKGRVECESNKCPSLEGCHAILFTRPKGHCCNVCKGCLMGESYLASGDVWSSAEDNCVINSCQAGVVTSSRELCRPPCHSPRHLPDQCCPTCPGCFHDGIEHLEGEVFTLKQNASVQCVCKRGHTTCSKRLCPVLNCPEEKIYFERGDKCPKCRGQRMVFDTPRSCFFAKRVFSSGERHVLDNCTSCVCVRGTMICDRQQCPEISCPLKDQIFAAGVCCPTCRRMLPCLVGNVTRKHEETWQPDACTSCTCKDGAARCAPKWCSHTSVCPEDYTLRYRADQCCPVCSRNDGVCTLRGQTSDVIETFDGRTYTIDGFCSHDLIRDCGHGQLTVKVKYKTKLGYQKHVDIVTIRFGSTSIKLYKSSEIRINRTNLFSNQFSSNNFSLSIQQSQITVKVNVGLHVHWNMKDRLSIKVSGNYFRSSSLCGLCGDFDGDESNDLVNKKGNQVEDPSQMAYTWLRGKLCRQHLSESVFFINRNHAHFRYQYHTGRLAAKHGHQQQTGLFNRSYTEPNETLQVLDEVGFNYRNNTTSGSGLNQAALLLNNSFTSENIETVRHYNSSEFSVNSTETIVQLDTHRVSIKEDTEKTAGAVSNTSIEDEIRQPQTTCHTHTREWMQARDACQKINHMKLETCAVIFDEASFVRSCADVLCACLKDQLCKETAMKLFLLPCRASHEVTVNPPP